MKHPLVVQYDKKKDEELLKLLRFHSAWDQQTDPKIARLLRLAANRSRETLNPSKNKEANFDNGQGS